MKKLSKLLLVVLLVLCIGSLLVACDDPTPEPPADPVATSITVTGQKTDFLTGDDFATGDMVVTITYDDDSTKIAEAGDYTVDSSAYDKDVAAAYNIKVKLNGTGIETTYAVTVATRYHNVVADAGITITGGVSNGKTSAGQTITLTASASNGKHLVAVKVNGTALTAVEGVYSFATDTYLTAADSQISITLEQAAHDYADAVTAPTCKDGGYTTYTCACGDSYVADETESLNLLGDLTKWAANEMSLEAIEGGVKVTQVKDQTWGAQYRHVTIDIEKDKFLVIDFDSITPGATFQVQFIDGYKKDLPANSRSAISMADLGITASGEYVLNIYLNNANQGASAIVRELSFAEEQDATIHTYGSASATDGTCHDAGVSVKTCSVCGAVHTDIVDEAEFLYAGGSWGFGEGLTMSYADHVATLTVAEGKTWGGSWRTVNLKTTDYLRFAGIGKFKVEIKAQGADAGQLLIHMQEMDGTPMVVALNTLVPADGEYTILIYAEGAAGSSHRITECFILSSADENVHSLGDWTVDGDSRTRTCSVCGITETQNKVSVTFNADNGEENAVVKVWPGDKVSAPETAPTKQGYVFSKWQLGDADFSFDSAITESITLKAIYAPATDTAYKIEYYEQTADGYAVKKTDNLTGTTGATVNALASGYTPADPDALKFDEARSILSGTIAADGSLVLKVYYSYAIQVTFDMGYEGGEDQIVNVAKGETVSAIATPTRVGYTFDKWTKDGAEFDFATEISENITLVATWTANTNTKYAIEIYEQDADGQYTLADTLERTGTTGDSVTLNGSEYTPNDSDLSLYEEYELNVLSGTIAADGSLVLKAYYAHSAKIVYEVSFYGELKEIVVTGVPGSQISANVLQNGTKVGDTLSATVTDGSATIDASSLQLANAKVQIELLDGVIAQSVTINTVDSLDLGTELYNDFANYQGGMVFTKQGSCPEIDADGKLLGTNSYVYPNDFLTFNFANIVANVKTLSVSATLNRACGCGGDDGLVFWEIHGQQGFSTGVVVYGASGSGTLALNGDQLRAANLSQLQFDLLLGCSGNGHGTQEWIDLGLVSAELSYSASMTALYRDVEIKTETVYETSFYGKLGNIKVTTSAEDGTPIQVNVLQNGVKVGETLSATVASGAATIDASSLNLANTKIQIQVLGDIVVTSVNLDTIDSLDLGVALNKDMQGYEGGMVFSVNNAYKPNETGRITMPNTFSVRTDAVMFDMSNILANLKSLSFTADYGGYCQCGGIDYIVFWELHNSGKDINGLVVASTNTTGAEVTSTGTFNVTGDLLRSYGNAQFGLDMDCGCSGNGHGPEWVDLGVVTAELSYTATATQIYVF